MARTTRGIENWKKHPSVQISIIHSFLLFPAKEVVENSAGKKIKY